MRNVVKDLVRAFAGGRCYTRITDTRLWTLVLVNCELMHSPLFRRFIGGRAWPEHLCLEGTNICNAKGIYCAYPLMQRPKVKMPLELFMRTVAESVYPDWMSAVGPREDVEVRSARAGQNRLDRKEDG